MSSIFMALAYEHLIIDTLPLLLSENHACLCLVIMIVLGHGP